MVYLRKSHTHTYLHCGKLHSNENQETKAMSISIDIFYNVGSGVAITE